MKRFTALALAVGLTLALNSHLFARPLVTEEVQTLGIKMFEVSTSLSQRVDKFGDPEYSYITAHLPVTFKFGLTQKADIGFTTQYISQDLEQPGITLHGSENADFAAHFKYAVSEYIGFMGTLYQKEHEDTDDEMPIGHGNDVELQALFKIPISFASFHFNTGYVWRGEYDSQFGIRGAPRSRVEPGNIFENRLSMEWPMFWNLNLLGETAYYLTKQQRVNGTALTNSDGEVLDGLMGLTWSYRGWNLGTGVGTSFLDESHTSFNLTRGMGDLFYKFYLAYQFRPRKPSQ